MATAAAAGPVESYDTIIIGGGVSGLTTAFTLGRNSPGVRLLVTEARDYVGGNINTQTKDGYTWEEGPNSYQPGDAILTVACDAGMGMTSCWQIPTLTALSCGTRSYGRCQKTSPLPC